MNWGQTARSKQGLQALDSWEFPSRVIFSRKPPSQAGYEERHYVSFNNANSRPYLEIVSVRSLDALGNCGMMLIPAINKIMSRSGLAEKTFHFRRMWRLRGDTRDHASST